MSLPERIDLPPELPRLELELRPLPPNAWPGVLHRLRRRRRRAASAVAAATAAVVAAPVLLLATPGSAPVQTVAHAAADAYDGICDVAYDEPAPAGDRLAAPFRVGQFYFSPPGANQPAVPAQDVRRRAERRGVEFRAGSQLRYAVVRTTRGGMVAKTEARWVLTTCGEPRPRFLRTNDPTQPMKAVKPDVLSGDVQLLTDSGHPETSAGGAAFAGVCDVRLDQDAPDLSAVTGGFHVGEALVTAPREGAALTGRQRVEEALRSDGRKTFPGTQIRLGMVQPLHRPGEPRLRWLVTTCSLDGASVRPVLPGVVNELLVYDRNGRLLQEHRSGPQSEAETALAGFPPLPATVPTHRAAHPNICGPWSHANPDLGEQSRAAGYDDMQGCYRQADSVVVFLSRPTGRAVAALATCTRQEACEKQYADRYPYETFELVPAPLGSRAELLRLLSPTVAEVRLSGDGRTPTSMKFDADSRRWLPCDDTTATRAACAG